ncbi:MAG: hypothetical protein GXO69_08380 [Acidobacteria bacterium]|nr:hypothetical protein [Acidobacteriota bacterium]
MKQKITLVLIILALIFVSGCVRAPKETVKSRTEPNQFIFYPPLPNQPRYQFLATISSSKDIRQGPSKLFKFIVGSDQDKPTPINKAYGSALAGDRLYVCDIHGGLRVIDFKKHSFTTWGLTEPGNLTSPINVAIDKKNGLVYVADIGRKQVMVYDQNGRFVRAYGSTGQFEGPVDVVISGKHLFVCDVRKHQVHVVDMKSGKTLYDIGKPGSGNDELFHPTNIAIEGGKLYVSDTTNFRVQIFSLKGKPISRFGQVGDKPGMFSRPKGIAVDREGRIYVADAAFENIQVFNKKHQLLLFFLSPGNGKGMINLPAGISISYDIPQFFRKKLAPGFQAKYLLLVNSEFGRNKVNVYAFGSYKK